MRCERRARLGTDSRRGSQVWDYCIISEQTVNEDILELFADAGGLEFCDLMRESKLLEGLNARGCTGEDFRLKPHQIQLVKREFDERPRYLEFGVLGRDAVQAPGEVDAAVLPIQMRKCRPAKQQVRGIQARDHQRTKRFGASQERLEFSGGWPRRERENAFETRVRFPGPQNVDLRITDWLEP
jgi:hypothetical protein